MTTTIPCDNDTFPFREKCDLCTQELLHHHTGNRTKGMPHEGGSYYCWCLSVQEPVTNE